MRPKPKREHFIPKGAFRVSDKASSAEVHVYGPDRLCAMAFSGRAQKPRWHFRFRTTQQRDDKITAFFESARARDNHKRAKNVRKLEVGDILRASWGYDQTNVDFYEVTALIGKTMVEIREISQSATETGFMSGLCEPLPGQFIGPPVRKRAQGDSVKVSQCAWAFKIEPKAETEGQRVYAASHWSAYA